MKKKEFTELIRLSLIKDVNPLVVDKYVSMTYDSYVQGYWMSIKGGSLDVFTKLFEGVEIRNEGKQYYSDLPASLIDLPRTGGGVMNIHMIGSMDLTFVPVTIVGHQSLNELEVYKLTGPVPFVVTKEKVYYKSIMYGIDKVNMHLLIKYEEYLPDDNIVFPPNSEMAIRDIVWQFLNQMPPEDKVIDSNEKTN